MAVSELVRPDAEVMRMTTEEYLVKQIMEAEEKIKLAYEEKRRDDKIKLFAIFEAYKTKNEKKLQEYKAKCTGYEKQINELTCKYEDLKDGTERTKESFRTLHLRLMERMEQITHMLSGFRQALLNAWNQQRQVLLVDLKNGWQKDSEEAAKLLKECEQKRAEAEIRATKHSREVSKRQQEWNQRVSELELKQGQVLRAMSKYWKVFEKWLKQNAKADDIDLMQSYNPMSETVETASNQLDIFLRRFQQENPTGFPSLIQKLVAKHVKPIQARTLDGLNQSRKQTLCKFWVQGQCKYGFNCSYVHEKPTYADSFGDAFSKDSLSGTIQAFFHASGSGRTGDTSPSTEGSHTTDGMSHNRDEKAINYSADIVGVSN